MKKQILIFAMPILMLGACAESQETEAAAEADPLADLAAGTGAYLVSYEDGTQSINYASADGAEYTATMEGDGSASWAVEDGNICVTLPEDGFCLEIGELAEDGSFTASQIGGEGTATMHRLDKPVTTREEQLEGGSFLVDLEDGQALVVWAEGGVSYFGANVATGTWRSDGTVRCTTFGDGEESCGSPNSEIAEDGSFTAEDNGQSITVTML